MCTVCQRTYNEQAPTGTGIHYPVSELYPTEKQDRLQETPLAPGPSLPYTVYNVTERGARANVWALWSVWLAHTARDPVFALPFAPASACPVPTA